MSVQEFEFRKDAYKGRRQAKHINVHVGTSMHLDVVVELEAMAREHNSKLAKIVRQLTLRGLAAYRRDGLLNEPIKE